MSKVLWPWTHFSDPPANDYIFAASDVSTRIDQPLPHSGVHAVRADPGPAHQPHRRS